MLMFVFSFHGQRVQSFDKRYQYLLFAAEPYEIIAFKAFHSQSSGYLILLFDYYCINHNGSCCLYCYCRFLARRLTNPLPSSSHIGIRTQKCSRFAYILLVHYDSYFLIIADVIWIPDQLLGFYFWAMLCKYTWEMVMLADDHMAFHC